MQEETRNKTCGWATRCLRTHHNTPIRFIFILSAAAGGLYSSAATAADNPNDSPRRNVLVGPIDQSSNPNEVNIGISIEDLCPQLVAKDNSSNPLVGLERDLRDRCVDIIAEAGGEDDLSAELRQLTADEIFTMTTGAVQLGTVQLARIGARLGILRTAGAGFSAFALQAPRSYESDAPLSLQYQSGGAAGDDFGRLGVFVNGSVSSGDKDQTTREAGFDFDAYDLTLGIDYRIKDNAFLGVSVGVMQADADIDRNSSNSIGGKVDTDGYTLTGYGTAYRADGLYVEGSLGYGNNDYDTERDIRYSVSGQPVAQTAIGETDGEQVFAHVGVGKDFYKQSWTVNVSGRLDYLDGDVDGFRERMRNPGQPGGGMPLEISEQDIESLTTTLGLQVSKAVSTARGVMQPYGRLEWIHQFEDESKNVEARFAFDPFSENFVQGGASGSPTIFSIESDELDSDYFRAGGGLSFQFAGGKAGFIAVDTVLGLDDVSQWVVTAGFRWELGQGAE